MKFTSGLTAIMICLLSASLLTSCQQYSASLPAATAPLAHDSSAILTISVGSQQRSFNQQQLLAMAKDRLAISNDAAYHDQRWYQVIALEALLGSGLSSGHLQFVASDGFVATLPVAALHSGAKAWLAVEDPTQPWPALKSGGASAGPLYLVWTHPEAAKISNEQWPYQIAQINLVLPLEQRFPQLLPLAERPVQSAALRGMQVYINNCSSCHSLNHGGDAQIGPDLNLPMNPLDYFQESALRKMIRSPASVRSWKQSQMPGFSLQQLPETDLDDLIVYLRQMSRQRQ